MNPVDRGAALDAAIGAYGGDFTGLAGDLVRLLLAKFGVSRTARLGVFIQGCAGGKE